MAWVVVCAGLNRSGSTWQYNAARLMFEQLYGETEIWAGWIGDYDSRHPASVHIVKAHAPNELGNLVPNALVTSYRDLREVAASMIRMRWSTDDHHQVGSFLEQYIRHLDAWRALGAVPFSYDSIIGDPAAALQRMARVLGLHLSAAKLDAVQAALKALKPACDQPSGHLKAVDPVALLHDGHFAKERSANLLSPYLQGMIEARFGGWLAAHGYIERAMVEQAGPAYPQLGPGAHAIARVGHRPGLLRFGFDLEVWGAWSVAPLCGVSFARAEGMASRECILLTSAIASQAEPGIAVEAFCNGTVAGAWRWLPGETDKGLTIALPEDAAFIDVVLQVQGARAPKEQGLGLDTRRLGVALHSLLLP